MKTLIPWSTINVFPLFHITIASILLLPSKTEAQRFYQDLHGPRFYEASQGTQFNIVKLSKGDSGDGGLKEKLSEEFKLSHSNFYFKVITIKDHPGKEYKIVEISFPDYKRMKRGRYKSIETDSANSSNYIDSSDNGSIFWMKETVFNELLEKQFIRKYYRRRYPSFAYGATFALPFKMRPETHGQNMKLTPEIQLGGYAGCRIRLTRHSDFSITLPTITLGVSTLGVNDNNTINENASQTDIAPDGLVLGRTVSLGAILQYNNFQMGVVMGWDKASGEIGKNWIYNDKPWYSFSIGFSFLADKKE